MESTSQPSDPKQTTVSPALSRRALLRGGSAFMLAVGATALPNHTAQAQDTPPTPAMRSPHHAQIAATAADADKPALPHIAIIAMTRMAFGPTPDAWVNFSALGSTDEERFAAYVEQQLYPDAINDDACSNLIANWGFTTLNKSLSQLWADHAKGEAGYNLPASEVEVATFLRAIYSKRQLQEVLADHWHNHFNVYAWSGWASPTFVHYDRDVIRKHLFGNFRAMLEDVATSPAMLDFLDNQSNSGDKPNENYARELFELHGMGAENYFGVRSIDDPAIKDANGNRLGYIDSDVYGATTCFTGWRLNTTTGQFEFDESRHFPYTKVVLGKIIPEFQGIKDGRDVLDLLAYHPASARYICRRLCRRLISDNPPESIVQAAADVFIANQTAPDQMRTTLRTILLSNEFRTTWAEKIKRPFEFSVSVMRAMGAEFGMNDFFWHYDGIGQPLFGWKPPNGYPDDREAWTSTMPMLQRWRHCNSLFNWRIGGDGEFKDVFRLRPEAYTPSYLTTASALVEFWSRSITGQSLPANERQIVTDFMAGGHNPDFNLPAGDIAERLRHMVALICMSPSFQWR